MLLLIAGIITTATSFGPSPILQYIFIGISAAVGAMAFVISRQAKNNFVRSKYYFWIGSILFAMAVSLSLWATTLAAFITVMGFFLLLLGIIEFVFAQQIFNYYTTPPWPLLGFKLVIATVAATGAVWILTMVRIYANVSLFFLGVLFVVVGFAFVGLSRITKTFKQTIGAAVNN